MGLWDAGTGSLAIEVTSHSYDMSDLQAGVYVLKFYLEGGGILTKKLVKM